MNKTNKFFYWLLVGIYLLMGLTLIVLIIYLWGNLSSFWKFADVFICFIWAREVYKMITLKDEWLNKLFKIKTEEV